MQATAKDVVKLSELLKNIGFYYENALPKEKDEIISQIFSELTINGDTLKYKCKNGFAALESRFIPNCDQFTWLSELSKYSTFLPSDIATLETILAGAKNQS